MSQVTESQFQEFISSHKAIYFLLRVNEWGMPRESWMHTDYVVVKAEPQGLAWLNNWEGDPNLEVSIVGRHDEARLFQKKQEYMSQLKFSPYDGTYLDGAVVVTIHFVKHPEQADTPHQSHST